MDRRASPTPRPPYLLYGILACVLLLGIPILIIVAIDLADDNDPNCCGLADSGRGRAENVGSEMLLALSQILVDPEGMSRQFASFFDEDGVFSQVIGNARGRHHIAEAIELYATTGHDTNLVIRPKKMYWDAKLSTLTIEMLWSATTNHSRQFLDADNDHVVHYPAGTPYQQDDAIIIRFNCNFKVVYYRDYFDQVQLVSTFTKRYDPVCTPCGGAEPHHEHDRDHPHHPRTEEPTPAPTSAPILIGSRPDNKMESLEYGDEKRSVSN